MLVCNKKQDYLLCPQVHELVVGWTPLADDATIPASIVVNVDNAARPCGKTGLD